jgi:predicted phosphodiesterase
MKNKIAVISDIHGNILALEKVVDDINRRGVSHVINLGDHVSGPLWPKETIDYIKKQEWIQIMGNHERQLLSQNPEELGPSDIYAYERLDPEDLEWLRFLPETLEPLEGMMLFHGSPNNDKLYLLETLEHGRARLATQNEITDKLGKTRSPIMLCGHTHIPRVIELPGGELIINPGSVGSQAYDDVSPVPHVMETGSPHARYAIIEKIDERWTIELVMVSYDHEAAAKKAKAAGRKDWETGIRTGYMSI